MECIRSVSQHLNVGIFMFYVDAAAVIEFGTRYNIVFKRILLYCYHLYTGTGLMIIWGGVQ